MNARQLVHRHPLAVFLIWFFTVGQAIVLVPAVTELPAEPFIVTTFVGLLLPAAAITRIVTGPQGLRALRRRTFRVELPVRGYALAVIGVPTASVAVATVTAGISPTSTGLVSTVGAGFRGPADRGPRDGELVGRGREDGLHPGRAPSPSRSDARRRRHRRRLRRGHIPLVLGDGPSATFTLAALLLAVSIPFRALAAWVYNRTDGLLLVGMIHAAANAVAAGSILGAGLLPCLYGNDSSFGLAFPSSP